MTLPREAMLAAVEQGAITVSPFDPLLVGAHSIDYRLGTELKVCVGTDGYNHHAFEAVTIPDDGYVLQPGIFYLGHTFETIGSDRYAMRLTGKRGLGRLGLWVQFDADLGHTTACHQWTLEMRCHHPIIVRPQMVIGQVSFAENLGAVLPYTGRHAFHNGAQESLYSDDGSSG